jgi:uncharacterized protein (DUF488 family)
MQTNSIYSIGYGSRQITTFVSLLQRYKISTIVDVRSTPYSRFHPTYNQSKFQEILSTENIQYVYKGYGLGGKPTDKSLYLNGELNYSSIISSIDYQNSISDLIAVASQFANICIMCCELDPEKCHRKTIIGKTLFQMGIAIKHIGKDGVINIHSEESSLFTN